MARQLNDQEKRDSAHLVIELTPKSFTVQVNGLIDGQVVVHNVGPTVASEIRMEIELSELVGAHGGYAEPPGFNPEVVPHPIGNGPNLAGGDRFTFPFTQFVADWQEVTNLRTTIIIWTYASYRNIFGVADVAPYCLYYQARPNRFVTCPSRAPGGVVQLGPKHKR